MVSEFNPQYEKSRLENVTEGLLARAKALGADACEVSASASAGLDVTARLGQAEKLEMTRDQSVTVTAFIGQSRGTATTTDLSAAGLSQTLDAALAIAKVTAPDAAAVLATADQMIQAVEDLSLDHPWELTPAEALALAIEIESIGLAVDSRLVNSDGGSVSTTRSVAVHGTSEGLMVSQAGSVHGMSCVLLAESGDSRERAYAYTQARRFEALQTPEWIGREAAEKTLARLHPRKCETGPVPVLFTSEAASGLLGSVIGAISGSAIYRESSYLLDRIGTRVFPDWVDLYEDPRLLAAMGSSAYDTDGLPTKRQAFVEGGYLTQYVLSLYSAKRLGLVPTHNGGGVRNLYLSGDATFEALIRQMDRGLIVTDMMGQGVNLVNGDYSRGASGFWVEHGEIQYPVHEVTVASNLDRMMRDDLVAVGRDVDLRRSITSGSMLFQSMMVAGS